MDSLRSTSYAVRRSAPGHAGVVLLALLLAASPALSAGGGVLYVDDDAPAGGDGSTWETAFRFLQDAMAVEDATEIRIGQGLYLPDRDEVHPAGTGDRAASFWTVEPQALCGGYAGYGAPDPDQRDFSLYHTILSGDLAEDDGPQFMNNDENAYHVVVADPRSFGAVLLEGLIITAGNANGGAYELSLGGGLWNQSFDTVVRNCMFYSNWAVYGGAVASRRDMIISDSTFLGNSAGIEAGAVMNRLGPYEIEITRCDFVDNFAQERGGAFTGRRDNVITLCTFIGNSTNGSGGAIWGAHLDVSQCLFAENVGGNSGGAVRLSASPHFFSNRFEDCAFIGNTSDGEGGAVESHGTYPAHFLRCLFEGNSATAGGAMCHSNSSALLVEECEFHRNTALKGACVHFPLAGDVHFISSCFTQNAAALGGVLSIDYSSELHFDDCAFIENEARLGGVVYTLAGSSYTRCIFTGNNSVSGAALYSVDAVTHIDSSLINDNATSESGAVYAVGGSASLINCTIYRNHSDSTSGGALVSEAQADVAAENCILWGNEPRQEIGATVRYSNHQDECEGTGNISADPRFVDPIGPDGVPGTLDDDFRLREGSPCIDAADNAAVPGDVILDLAGEERFVDDPGMPDIGAGDPPIVDMGAYEFDGVTICAADLDGDGSVGLTDLLPLLDDWGDCTACRGDLDRDCSVTLPDLLVLLASWGSCPTGG